jgi:molybdate-binding protein
VTREVGLAFAARRPRRPLLGALPGSRFASRPATAGIRRRLDEALERAGTDLDSAYRGAVELGSHRDVVLAVASGKADVGLTTHAWAARASLHFQALATEAYHLVVSAERLGDPAVVALCELMQSGAFRTQLEQRFGYDVSKTGEIRITPEN